LRIYVAQTGLSFALAGLAVAGCLAGPTPTPPITASPAPSTAAPTSSPVPPTPTVRPSDTPLPSPSSSPTGPTGLGWSAAALPVDGTYSTVGAIDVTVRDGVFLAVGVGWQEDDKGVQVNEPLFWLSDDGAAWELIGDAAWPGGNVDAVAAWQGRFVAGGYVGDERATAAFWTSDDGRTWERLPDQPVLEFFRGATEGRDIVAGGMADLRVEGDDLVALGWLYCACASEIREGTIEWRSSDGVDWQREDRPPEAGWQEPLAGGPGWLRIAADGSALEGSTDQLAWQTVWAPAGGPDGGPRTAQLFALRAYADGYLALGSTLAGEVSRPLAVSSADGLAWSLSAGWPAIDDLHGSMFDFAAADGLIVAVGQAGDPALPHVWVHPPIAAAE
jgi:hypothetical protein